MSTDKLANLKYELENLHKSINIYLKSNDYVYSNVFRNWTNKFNNIIENYNQEIKIDLQKFDIYDWYYSSTGKTMRGTASELLLSDVSNLIKKLELEITQIREKEFQKDLPFHQIRRCFKLGVEGCRINPEYDHNRVFIGMPFSSDYIDSYNYGIVPALDSLGYSHFRADNEVSNRDIMCKVCKEIQTCGVIIINISGLNPNVMLELGIAYGVGKPVIILKDRGTKTISDLGSIEYIEYAHALELRNKLTKALEDVIA